ncbi:MAG TPA: DUF1559 domain-containing protein [Planctomycetaceae bacterium]|nr:DUF1559 domain-containing protein [Planctomycetaceae bacterium]
MTRRQSTWAWTSLFVILGGLIGSAAGLAQEAKTPPPEKLLPSDALLFVGWDGTAAHRAAWEKSAAHEAIVKSGLGDVVAKLMVYAGQEAGGGIPVEQITSALEQIGKSGFYLAVGVPFAGQGPPMPQATIVVPGGASAIGQINALVEQMNVASVETQSVGKRKVTRARLRDLPFVDLGWWAEGKHLVIAAGPGAVETALNTAAGKGAALDASPTWKKFRAKAGFDVALTAWIDLAQVRNLAGGFRVGGDVAKPATVNDILEPLGLAKIGTAAIRVGFKDKALWTETTIEAPSPRTGLLAFDTKPLKLEELPPLPAGTDGFYASRINWSSLGLGLVRIGADVSRQIIPPQAPPFDAMLAGIQAQLGVDFQKDLFEPLGDIMVLYGDMRQGVFGLGSGLAISVDDARTLRATFDKLLERLAEGAGPDVRVESVKKSGRTVHFLEFPGVPMMVNPALAVDDKWLIIGLYPQTVDAFLRRLDGKLERWTMPADAKAALAELPGKYTSFTYSDPREGIRTALSFAPIMAAGFDAMWGRRAMRFGGLPVERESPISSADMPPAEVVTGPLFPNISVCTPTDNEIRWISRTSVPAIPFLGGAGIGNASVTAPVLAALLLPAVQQARVAARRTQSSNNLKQIGLALHNFHESHQHFPAGTHENEKLKPEKRLSWQVDLLPFVDQAPVYNQIDFVKAWDEPPNEELLKLRITVFQNPGGADDPLAKFGMTHYVGIAGLGKDGPLLDVDDKKAGFFGYNRVTRIHDVTDGTSFTIAVSEANKDLGPWGAGGLGTIRSLTKEPYVNGPDGLGGIFHGGMHVLMVDGSVRFISEKIDPRVLEALSTIAGEEPIGDF